MRINPGIWFKKKKKQKQKERKRERGRYAEEELLLYTQDNIKQTELLPVKTF